METSESFLCPFFPLRYVKIIYKHFFKTLNIEKCLKVFISENVHFFLIFLLFDTNISCPSFLPCLYPCLFCKFLLQSFPCRASFCPLCGPRGPDEAWPDTLKPSHRRGCFLQGASSITGLSGVLFRVELQRSVLGSDFSLVFIVLLSGILAAASHLALDGRITHEGKCKS